MRSQRSLKVSHTQTSVPQYSSSLKCARNDQEMSLVNQIEELEKDENNLRIGNELESLGNN